MMFEKIVKLGKRVLEIDRMLDKEAVSLEVHAEYFNSLIELERLLTEYVKKHPQPEGGWATLTIPSVVLKVKDYPKYIRESIRRGRLTKEAKVMLETFTIGWEIISKRSQKYK